MDAARVMLIMLASGACVPCDCPFDCGTPNAPKQQLCVKLTIPGIESPYLQEDQRIYKCIIDTIFTSLHHMGCLRTAHGSHHVRTAPGHAPKASRRLVRCVVPIYVLFYAFWTAARTSQCACADSSNGTQTGHHLRRPHACGAVNET